MLQLFLRQSKRCKNITPVIKEFNMTDELKKLTDWNKLQDLLAESDKGRTLKIDQEGFEQHCLERVKGQDDIIKSVTKLIRLESIKSKRQKPIASFIFLGATGTGKTELAKAICSYLYNDEANMLRFDCSEFSGSHSKDRLIGVPTGYVGAEKGGHLTRPLFHEKKRVILFDEIEKADPSVFDLFLQLLGEGRLTEQSTGKVADFTESIIILTSNAMAEDMGRLKKEITDPVNLTQAVKSNLADSKVFRTEIIGRIDKICIFNPLEGNVMAEIIILKINKLAKDYYLKIDFIAPEVIMDALMKNKKISRFGVRELERILFDMFAENFAELSEKKNTRCEILLKENKITIVGKK